MSGGFAYELITLSEPLATFVGESQITRPRLCSYICSYCRLCGYHGIYIDETLRLLLDIDDKCEVEDICCYEFTRHLKKVSNKSYEYKSCGSFEINNLKTQRRKYLAEVAQLKIQADKEARKKEKKEARKKEKKEARKKEKKEELQADKEARLIKVLCDTGALSANYI